MEVKLFAGLREKYQKKSVNVDWYEGMDGYALLEAIDIPAEYVSIFLINGRHSKPDAVLNEDDLVALFPPVGGG